MMPQLAPTAPAGLHNRWVQLTFMVLSTVMLSNMQYGWTLFGNPSSNDHNSGCANDAAV